MVLFPENFTGTFKVTTHWINEWFVRLHGYVGRYYNARSKKKREDLASRVIQTVATPSLLRASFHIGRLSSYVSSAYGWWVVT